MGTYRADHNHDKLPIGEGVVVQCEEFVEKKNYFVLTMRHMLKRDQGGIVSRYFSPEVTGGNTSAYGKLHPAEDKDAYELAKNEGKLLLHHMTQRKSLGWGAA